MTEEEKKRLLQMAKNASKQNPTQAFNRVQSQLQQKAAEQKKQQAAAQKASSTQKSSNPVNNIRKDTTVRKASASSSGSQQQSNGIRFAAEMPGTGLGTLDSLGGSSAADRRQSYLQGGSVRRRTNTDSRTGTNTSRGTQREADERNLQLNMIRWHNTTDPAERSRLNQENSAIRQRLGLSYDPRTGVTYNARTGRNYSAPTQAVFGGTVVDRMRQADQWRQSRMTAGQNEEQTSVRAHQVMNDLFSRSAEEWTEEDTRSRDEAVKALSDEMDRILERYGLQYNVRETGPNARFFVSDSEAVDRLRQAGADETTLAYVQENINQRQAADRLGQGFEAVAKRAIGSIPALFETAQQQAENVEQSRQNPEFVQLEQEEQQLESQLTSMPSTNYDGSLNQDYLEIYNRLQSVRERKNQLAVQTPVDQSKWGQTMLREAAEAQANATAGLATVPRFLVNTGISIAGNAPGMAASLIPGAGPVVGAGLMGASAAGQRAQELSAEGASPSEALGRGIASGIIEAVTEKLPIDTLADILNRGGTDAVRSILRQMGIEAGEESASYMMNLASDWAAADPNAQFSFADLAEQALGGAISGGVYGGAGTLIGRTGAQTAQETAAAPRVENYSLVRQDAVQAVPEPVRQGSPQTVQQTAERSGTNNQERYNIRTQPSGNGTFWAVDSDMMDVSGKIPDNGEPPFIMDLFYNIDGDPTDRSQIPNEMLGRGIAENHVMSFVNFLRQNGYDRFAVKDLSEDGNRFFDRLVEKRLLNDAGSYRYAEDQLVPQRMFEVPSIAQQRLAEQTERYRAEAAQAGSTINQPQLRPEYETRPESTYRTEAEIAAEEAELERDFAQHFPEEMTLEAKTQALGRRLAELDAEKRAAENLLPGPAREARLQEIEMEIDDTWRELAAAQTAEQARNVPETVTPLERLTSTTAETSAPESETSIPVTEAIRYGATPQQAMREAEVRAQGEAVQAAAQSEREETVSGLMQAWTDKRAAERQAEQTLAGLTLTDNDIRLAQNAAASGVDTVNWEYADNPEKAYLYGKALRAVREADQPIRQYFAQRAAAIQSEAQKAADAIATHAKDKRWGAAYQRETMERNIRDIFGKEHQAEAEAIIREYITPVHQAVAEGNKLKNSLRDRVKKLKLNKHERALVQMRLEAEDGAAAEYIKNNVLTVTPEMDAKINQAVQVFRDIYNDLYNRINETLLLNGQEPAPFRKNYAPHFTKDKPDTLLGKVRFALGLGKDSSLKLPTDIAGITDSFRPGKKWFGNLLQREGEITDYDAVEGFDQYVETAADVITLTESIQKLRALEDQVRYTLSDEGVQAKIDAIRANPELDALQQRQQIEDTYDTNRSSAQQLIDNLRNQKRMGMGRFVTELRRYTDNLAGKKSREDRGWEDMANRQVYQLAKSMESRVAANMISLNPGSWLTNLIPITQATGEVSVPNLVKGMYQTVKGAVTDDGYRDASAFLTNRYGSDRLDQTITQRVSNLSGAPMELIDHFVANTIHRARYAQNISKGMGVGMAIEDADAYTASLMADRSKGALPTAFNATNPVRKVFTMFQTEVNNQLSYLFKDMPKAQRKKGVAAVAWAYTKVFGTAYLFNLAYSALTGRDAALDPVGMIADALGVGDDEDEERTGWDVAADLALGTAENLPFVGGLLGGGRVPIQSAFPNPLTIWNSLSGEAAPQKKAQTVGKELAKPLTYLVPPFGGGAAKRVIEGFATVDAGGSYTYDNKGNRILQFPAYGQKPQDYARAMLFGKWSSEEAQEYIENGFKGLSADETAVFDQLRNNMGLDARQAMDTILSLRGFESVKDSEGNTVQTVKDQQRLALFDNENLTPEQKAAVDRALIVSGEDEQPADYSDRNAFLLGQYVSESRRDAARSALETGLSIDQFVQWDDRLSELKNEKGTDDKAVRSAAEARQMTLDEILKDSTLSDSEKQALADYVLISSIGEEDEKARKNWETIAKGKVNASDFVRFQADASVYDAWAEGTGTDNAANVAEILRGYDGLTDEQRDVLFQTYRDNMSVNPFHVSVYEKSIDPNGSFYVALTDDGKARLRSLLNEYEQDINEGAELDEWRAKAYMAEKEAGISPATYAMYRVALETANTDDKGNPRQSEAEACVNAMDGLTQYQKAYLYASTNKSWKNNPFGSATVGEYSSGQEVGINPVAGATVTSRFGPRKSFQTDNGAMSSSLHPSIDIGAAEGTPIGAYKSGKVTQNGWVDGYGWTIEVTHSDGTVSAYHHMMEQSPVAVGTEVKQGEQIGKVGQTGNSKGAHLDLTITRDGKPIDPATLIPELQDSATGYVWTGSNVYTNVTSGSGQSSGSSGGGSGSKKKSGFSSNPFDAFVGFKGL